MVLAKNDILWELTQWNRLPNNILFYFLPYHRYKNRLHCAKETEDTNFSYLRQ